MRSIAYAHSGKRIFDLILSIIALPLAMPILIGLSTLVYLKLGSPIFFSQRRCGQNGKPFMLYKFRTMSDDRDEQGNLLPDAIRLTPFGKFLRDTSLDELPALLNLLKGEMSLVGPRPLIFRYIDRYTPMQMLRHTAKPGITGWAQINGRNAISWEEKFALDIEYVEHQSLTKDLKILLMTVLKVFKREGIDQPGQVSMEEFMGDFPNPNQNRLNADGDYLPNQT